MSNGYGDVCISREVDMAAHDNCPPLLRYAVNYAVTKFSSKHVLQAWRAGMPERAMVADFSAADRKYTHKTYGPKHPEAVRD